MSSFARIKQIKSDSAVLGHTQLAAGIVQCIVPSLDSRDVVDEQSVHHQHPLVDKCRSALEETTVHRRLKKLKRLKGSLALMIHDLEKEALNAREFGSQFRESQPERNSDQEAGPSPSPHPPSEVVVQDLPHPPSEVVVQDLPHPPLEVVVQDLPHPPSHVAANELFNESPQKVEVAGLSSLPRQPTLKLSSEPLNEVEVAESAQTSGDVALPVDPQWTAPQCSGETPKQRRFLYQIIEDSSSKPEGQAKKGKRKKRVIMQITATPRVRRCKRRAVRNQPIEDEAASVQMPAQSHKRSSRRSVNKRKKTQKTKVERMPMTTIDRRKRASKKATIPPTDEALQVEKKIMQRRWATASQEGPKRQADTCAREKKGGRSKKYVQMKVCDQADSNHLTASELSKATTPRADNIKVDDAEATNPTVNGDSQNQMTAGHFRNRSREEGRNVEAHPLSMTASFRAIGNHIRNILQHVMVTF